MSETTAEDLFPYRGDGAERGLDGAKFPKAPPWRDFKERASAPSPAAENERRGRGLVVRTEVTDAVNAALLLRRPLLVTGKPGTGKSTLAYAVAHELKLGAVLVWSITSRSTLQQGLYSYDAIARLHDEQRPRAKDRADETTIVRYLRLGPLGTALATSSPEPLRPRVLLIDEIDKSDLDLPNDLLHVFEEGRFEIPEFSRLPDEKRYQKLNVPPADDGTPVEVTRGLVQCSAFPFVVLTSNGERDFPPAFLRRCVRLRIPEPTLEELENIVTSRLGESKEHADAVADLVKEFAGRRDGLTGERGELATDQLLNAAYVLLSGGPDEGVARLRELVLRSLSERWEEAGP